MIANITFLVFDIVLVSPGHDNVAYLIIRLCSSKLAANQIRQYISNRIDESYSEKLSVTVDAIGLLV